MYTFLNSLYLVAIPLFLIFGRKNNFASAANIFDDFHEQGINNGIDHIESSNNGVYKRANDEATSQRQDINDLWDAFDKNYAHYTGESDMSINMNNNAATPDSNPEENGGELYIDLDDLNNLVDSINSTANIFKDKAVDGVNTAIERIQDGVYEDAKSNLVDLKEKTDSTTSEWIQKIGVTLNDWKQKFVKNSNENKDNAVDFVNNSTDNIKTESKNLRAKAGNMNNIVFTISIVIILFVIFWIILGIVYIRRLRKNRRKQQDKHEKEKRSNTFFRSSGSRKYDQQKKKIRQKK